MDEHNIEKLNEYRIQMQLDKTEKAIKKHPKLTFDDLVEKFDSKGIKFNEVDKIKAKKILSDLTYYYKISVYRRNFKKDKNGKYINLEFSYLIDIASTDMQLRYVLMDASLDIEHALKTYLISNVTNNEHLDGYEIVDRFFHSTIQSGKPITKESILERAKENSHYQKRLYEAHKDAPPIWVLVEVMGFGDFIRLFQFYFKKYKTDSFEISSLTSLLHAVKRIRNCCAHNNTFLFSISDVNIEHPNKYVKEYAKKAKIGQQFYSCTKIHDVIAVLYVHSFFVKGLGSKKHRKEKLDELTNKSIKRFEPLEKDNDVVYFFQTLEKLLLAYN